MNKFKKILAGSILFLGFIPVVFAATFSGYAHLDSTGMLATAELGNTYGQLSSVPSIDLKATGQTTLYTCPAAKTCVITDVIFLITSANTIAVPPIIRIGKAASYNEWLPLTTLTGLDTTNKFTTLATSAALLMHQTFTAGDVVKLDVQTGATATTLTGTAYVYGFNF